MSEVKVWSLFDINLEQCKDNPVSKFVTKADYDAQSLLLRKARREAELLRAYIKDDLYLQNSEMVNGVFTLPTDAEVNEWYGNIMAEIASELAKVE